MKKILALMLSVMMVVCMMPSMAFAEGETTLTSDNLTVEVSPANFTYNGSAQKPTVTVKYTPTSTDSSGESTSADVQSVTLTEGTDYTIGYQRNSSDTNDFISAGNFHSNYNRQRPATLALLLSLTNLILSVPSHSQTPQ